VFAALAVWVFWRRHHGEFPGWLDDPRVYTHAFEEWRAGRDPYGTPFLSMYFLYPPIFLYAMAWLSAVTPVHWGGYLYPAVNVLMVCALPLVLARYYIRQGWLSPLFALLVFFACPRFTGVLVLGEMNVASCAYLLAFVAAVPGLRRGRWNWLYAVIFVISMIKITFLLLLLLPLLVGRRQWMQSAACGVAVVAANLAERVAWPVLYERYEWSLTHGILVQQAFGYGIFGVLASYTAKRGGVGVGPYVVSVLIAALTLGMMVLLRRRLDRIEVLGRRRGQDGEDPLSSGIWLALVVMTIILTNPRQMQYDADIALFAGFVLWVYVLRRFLLGPGRLLGLIALLFLPSLAVPLAVLNPHLHGVYETVLLWQVFWLGFWKLWRDETMARRGDTLLNAVWFERRSGEILRA
jgi:hypothetical protein